MNKKIRKSYMIRISIIYINIYINNIYINIIKSYVIYIQQIILNEANDIFPTYSFNLMFLNY